MAASVKIGVAESALGAPATGFGDHEQYPDLVMKAAVLTSRLVRNHPLPDGNKRPARVAGIEFLLRNGYEREAVSPLFRDPEENDRIIRALASREISEEQFADWLRERLG